MLGEYNILPKKGTTFEPVARDVPGPCGLHQARVSQMCCQHSESLSQRTPLGGPEFLGARQDGGIPWAPKQVLST